MAEEDVADSWEDADTEELERRMEERQKQLEAEKKKRSKSKSKQQSSQQEVATGTEGEYSGGVVPLEVQTQLPLRIQDSNRTEYVAPIKILKRQSDPKGSGTSSAGQPQLSSSPSSSSSSSKSNKQHKSLAEREADYASARARILGTDYRPEDATTPTSAQTRIAGVSKETGSSTDSVKRHPKGPNGTKGFKH